MSGAGRPAALVVAGFTAAYGLVMAIANARYHVVTNNFTPGSDFVLFTGGSGFPDDFGRNVFSGTVALGALFVVLALVVALAAGTRPALTLGAVLAVLACVLVATFSSEGNLLGAKPSAAAVLLAVAIYLLASSLPERADPADR